MTQQSSGLPPKRLRMVRLSVAVVTGVVLLLIFAVGELFLLRASSRAQVRQLACYTVRYSPDTDQTAKEIRANYRCPPARALPTHPAAKRSVPPSRMPAGDPSTAPVGTAAVVGHAAPPSVPTATPSASGAPVRPMGPSAEPSVAPSASPSPSGLLGGLLCDPRFLPVCLR